MANVYVRSGAAGAGTGADWANAYTTLAAALTAKAAGDDFWVSEDHAETQASALTATSKGTAANPCKIYCVDHSGSVPPVAADLRTTATITTTGNNSITLNGFAFVYGIAFIAGSGATGTASINLSSGSNFDWRMELCSLIISTTGASSRIQINGGFSSATFNLLLRNCTITFGATGQGFLNQGGRLEMNGGSVSGEIIPTTIFSGSDLVPSAYKLSGVDLSAIGSGKNICSVAASIMVDLILIDCKLGASVSISTGSVVASGGSRVRVVNCDSANTSYRYFKQTYQGTITHEATIVRTGGATDGTTPISRKMVTTANSKIYSPLESDYVTFWNESLSAVTVLVPVITDNVTLTDAECWVEVEELGTSGYSLGVTVSDRCTTILTTPANQTTDSSSTWTTTGLTTPVKQLLSVTFTPASKGPVRARVMLAKPSTTVYFDPLILSSSGRQWMTTDGYVNEGAGGSGSSGAATLINGGLVG